MNLNLNPVNILPIPTWRWLKLNNSQIDVSDAGEYKIVEPSITNGNQPGLTINTNKNTNFPKLTTGMGQIAQEFAEGHAGKVLKMEVAANAEIVEPIIIRYDLPDNTLAANDNYIYVNEGATAKFIFVYASDYNAKGFHGSSVKIYAGENAKVEVMQLQVLGKDFYNFADVGSAAKSQGEIVLKQYDLGAKSNWLGINVDMADEKAKLKIKNLYLLGENQKLDINYVARIIGKKNKVKITSNGLLLNKAEKTFRGTLDFQPGCKGSIGTEAEDVVLLDENVVNKSIPIILCGEDDIQGDHAASIGEMDEQQVFYLRSRGLNDAQIRSMVIESKIAIIENDLPEELQALLEEYKKVAYFND